MIFASKSGWSPGGYKGSVRFSRGGLFINKKKDFFKSQINKNRSIDIISSSLLGGGNRVIMFKVTKNNFLVVSNKTSISNILPLNDIELANTSENN